MEQKEIEQGGMIPGLSDDSAALVDAVKRLSKNYRVVIHLFYYEDYGVKEIAGILRISESNVKTRLSRGRKLLKESLQEEWDHDE